MANDSCILPSSAVLHFAAPRTHTRVLRFRPPRIPDCTLRSVAARRRSRCAHRRRSATSAAAPLAAAAGVAARAAAPPWFQAAASLPGSRLGISVPGPSRLPSTTCRTEGVPAAVPSAVTRATRSLTSPADQRRAHNKEILAFFLPLVHAHPRAQQQGRWRGCGGDCKHHGQFEAGDDWQARYSAAVHCSRTQRSAVHSERQRSNRRRP